MRHGVFDFALAEMSDPEWGAREQGADQSVLPPLKRGCHTQMTRRVDFDSTVAFLNWPVASPETAAYPGIRLRRTSSLHGIATCKSTINAGHDVAGGRCLFEVQLGTPHVEFPEDLFNALCDGRMVGAVAGDKFRDNCP
jgi:hypothetical protein